MRATTLGGWPPRVLAHSLVLCWSLVRRDVSPARIESLLHLSLQMSSVASNDPYKDDVKCSFHKYVHMP